METIANNPCKPEEARSTPPGSPPTVVRRGSTYDLTDSQSSSNTSSPIRTFHERQQVAKQSLAVDGLLPPNLHAHHPRMEASFPVRLHQLLCSSEGRIIRWQPKNDGKSFTILNCDAFEAEVLPRLYRTANIEVFGQLLSLYGFQRVEGGPYEGDYYHSMFVRDKPQLAHMIRKGGGSGPVANPTMQPTAYAAMHPPMMQAMAMKHNMHSSMHASVMSRLVSLNFPGKLHYLLCHGIYDLGLEGIMRWQPGGHAFAVYSSEEFEMQGLAEMLGTPGHASFRAQLFLHGFQRVRSDGPDVEAYYHADFVREQPHLCRLIRSRNHMKSSIIRRTAVPSTPTPIRHPLVSPLSDTSMKSTISAASDSLFVDSHSGFLLTPESRSSDRRSNAKVPSHVTAPPLTPARESTDANKDESKPRKRPRVGQMMPQNYFPFKLHSLLTLAEKYGFQNILCWAQHGRCFLVNDKDLFCATVLPLFRHSEFASFRAQLKAYGFVRIGKSGPDKGGYYHNAFLRGRPELCATITRRPKNVNGTVRGRPKGRSNMDPDFYKMKFLPDLEVQPTTPPPGNIKDLLEAALTQITPPAVVTREVGATFKAVAGKGKAAGGQAIGQTRDTSEVVAKLVQQNDTSDTTLPVKLHALLNDAHDHAFNRVATWNDAGRSFIIVDEKVFGEDLCEKWLNLHSLAHFQDELQSYGFQRREDGPHKGSYYHEMFHKALPHLCRCIKKEENTQIPASDSSIESNLVMEVDTDPATGTESLMVATYFSSTSLGSADKRTNSPELEVAMALTAMDDRSSEGPPSSALVVDDAKSPAFSENEAVAQTKGEETIKSPASPLRKIKPHTPSVNKRRSLDPPASCDMLFLKEQIEKETIEANPKNFEGASKEGIEATIAIVNYVDLQHNEKSVKNDTKENDDADMGPRREKCTAEDKAHMEMTAANEFLNMEIALSCNTTVS